MSPAADCSAARLVELMTEHLGARRIEELPAQFVTVVTDLVDGHEMWLRRGPLVETIRAAIALPGLFTPVSIDGRWYVDGALVNPVPVSVCRALGAQLVIAVNLNADQIGRKRLPGTPIGRAIGFDLLEELGRTACRPGRRAAAPFFGRAAIAPSLFGVMAHSFNIMQDRITRCRMAGDPPDVVINPRSAMSACSSSIAPTRPSPRASAPPSGFTGIHEAMAIFALSRPKIPMEKR